MTLHLKSFAVLIRLRSSIDDLVEFDFRREVRKNHQLATAGPAVIAEHRAKIRDDTILRLRLLRRALGCSFLTMLIAGAALIISHFDKPPPPVLSLARVYVIASMFCFAWATLGRLGWAGQSIGGVTAIEMLDLLLFHLLYGLGALFGTAAAFLL